MEMMLFFLALHLVVGKTCDKLERALDFSVELHANAQSVISVFKGCEERCKPVRACGYCIRFSRNIVRLDEINARRASIFTELEKLHEAHCKSNSGQCFATKLAASKGFASCANRSSDIANWNKIDPAHVDPIHYDPTVTLGNKILNTDRICGAQLQNFLALVFPCLNDEEEDGKRASGRGQRSPRGINRPVATSSKPPKAPITTQKPPKAPITTQKPTRAPITTQKPAKAPITAQKPPKAPITTQKLTRAPITTHTTTASPISSSNPAHSSPPLSPQDKTETTVHKPAGLSMGVIAAIVFAVAFVIMIAYFVYTLLLSPSKCRQDGLTLTRPNVGESKGPSTSIGGKQGDGRAARPNTRNRAAGSRNWVRRSQSGTRNF